MQTTFVGFSNTCSWGWDFNSYDKHFIDNLADYKPYKRIFFVVTVHVTTKHVHNTRETAE